MAAMSLRNNKGLRRFLQTDMRQSLRAVAIVSTARKLVVIPKCPLALISFKSAVYYFFFSKEKGILSYTLFNVQDK
jgi:hypothetical protein